MPIYKNNRVQRVFRGDHKPVRIYHGANKIAGWEEATATGQSVTAGNTYNDAAHVEVQGNTELQSDYMECWGGSTQKTLTGKNLFDMDWSFSGDTRTHNGITFAKSADGVIASGTATAQAFTPPYEILDKLTVGKTYISSISCANVFPAFKYVENGTTLYATKLTITSSMTSVSIYYYIKADVTVNNALILLQIEEGETATDYEPYCGGKPSPNPDYPQAITPLVTAGTYKITTDYGIYEVTIPDLHGIGDVTDKVVFDAVSGKGYLDAKCGNVVIDGTNLKLSKNDTNTTSFLYYIHIYHAKVAGMCSNFSHYDRYPMDVAGKFNATLNDNAFYFCMKELVSGNNATLPNADEANQWVSQNPITVVYQLVTPIRTPLTFTKVGTSTVPELPVKAFGKNLLRAIPDKVDLAGVTWEVGANGHITASGVATGFSQHILTNNLTLQAGTYTISLTGTSDNVVISSSLRNIEGLSFPQTITLSKQTTVRIGLKRKGNTETTFDGYIQIEKTDTVTAYEPFNPTPPTSNMPSIDYPQTIVPASGTLTTSCGDNQSIQTIPPLYGIKNTDGTWAARDKLVIDDATKTAWIERDVVTIELAGTENWAVTTTNFFINIDSNVNSIGLCSHYVMGLTDGCFFVQNTGRLRFYTVYMYQTDVEWKSYLAAQHAAGTPVTVAYCAATPTIEPIDYIAAKTYYPQTVIELTSNLPMDMTTTYKHF